MSVSTYKSVRSLGPEQHYDIHFASKINRDVMTDHKVHIFFLKTWLDTSLNITKVRRRNPLNGMSKLSKALCCWVRGFVCTNELESYAGSSIVAGRVTHAGQVSREMPD
jgi:hypothetical protein